VLVLTEAHGACLQRETRTRQFLHYSLRQPPLHRRLAVEQGVAGPPPLLRD